MAKTIATITGTALKPGVSRNGRWYKPEHVTGAVQSAQERIAAGEKPMVMLTFHGAEDDSREIAATLTGMTLAEDGSAEFSAGLTDTPAGWDIARLTDTSDGQPAHLRTVSIRGAWTGRVRKERGPGGQVVEVGEGLQLDGVDFTKSPGVDGAQIKTFAWAKDGTTETTERVLITESVQEAHVTISEETAPAAPAVPDGVRELLRTVFGEHVAEAATPAVSKRGSGLSDGSGRAFADPGYQADKKQRYDLTTKAKAKSAWSFVNQADNAKLYSGPQLKQIKKRIVAALRKFGVTVAAEGWSVDPPLLLTEALVEYYGGDPSCAGSYSLSATNGPTTVSIYSYGCDPADLQVILAKACEGAGLALKSLDPDMDADIDLPGDGDESAPDEADAMAERFAAVLRGESAETLDALVSEARASAAVTETATDPAPDPAAANPEGTEGPAVSETTQEAAGTATAAPATLSIPQDIMDEAMRKAAKKAARRALAGTATTAPAESAPAAPATAAVTETDEQRITRIVEAQVAAKLAESAAAETEEARIARLVEQGVAAAKQQLTEQGGGPGRKGLNPGGTSVNEAAGGAGTTAGPELNAHGMPRDWPDKPLHQFSSDELDQYVGPAVTRHYLGDRANLIG